MHTKHVSHSGPICVLEASLSQCLLTLRDMSSNQKSSPAAERKFWNGVRRWGESGGPEWFPWPPEINTSDGWTSDGYARADMLKSQVLIRSSKLCFNPVVDTQESCFIGFFVCSRQLGSEHSSRRFDRHFDPRNII